MSAGHRPGDDGSDIATGSADGSADGTGTGATDRLGGAPVPFLDLGLQHRAIAADVDTAFARILDRCSFVGGSDVGEFEIAFGAYCGAEHAVGVANGTDAIVMALRALGIGPGDRHGSLTVSREKRPKLQAACPSARPRPAVRSSGGS